MLTWFFSLFESKKSRNIRLARERAERRQRGREPKITFINKNERERHDLRHGHNVCVDNITK